MDNSGPYAQISFIFVSSILMLGETTSSTQGPAGKEPRMPALPFEPQHRLEVGSAYSNRSSRIQLQRESMSILPIGQNPDQRRV